MSNPLPYPVLYGWWSNQDHSFVDVTRGMMKQSRWVFPRGDFIVLRIAGMSSSHWQWQPQNGFTVPQKFQANWSGIASGIFGMKTATNNASHGDFIYATPGFYSADTDWHDPAVAQLSIALALDPSVVPDDTEYVGETQLADMSANKASMAMPQIRVPLQTIVGTETNPPPGYVASLFGKATIPAGSDNWIVPYTGMTSGGTVLAFWRGPALGEISAIAATNYFTIQNSGPVPADTIVGYYIMALA